MLQKNLALFVLWFLAQWPFPLCQAIGRGIGWLLWMLDSRGRKVTQTNLMRCFPEWSVRECRDRAQACFVQTSQTFVESAYIWQNPPQSVLSRVVEVEGKAALDAILETGGQALIAAPHLGNWEVLGLFLGQHYSCASMYRPPNQAFLEDLMRRGREASGAVLVPANRQGVGQMVRHLGKPERIAAILPDQDPAAGEGVFAPFFGIEANTMTLLSRLAGKLAAPVFLGYAERLRQGKFRIRFVRLTDDVANPEMRTALASLNSAIEAEVRRLPEQYLWLYKRFKTRPEGKPRFYP